MHQRANRLMLLRRGARFRCRRDRAGASTETVEYEEERGADSCRPYGTSITWAQINKVDDAIQLAGSSEPQGLSARIEPDGDYYASCGVWAWTSSRTDPI